MFGVRCCFTILLAIFAFDSHTSKRFAPNNQYYCRHHVSWTQHLSTEKVKGKHRNPFNSLVHNLFGQYKCSTHHCREHCTHTHTHIDTIHRHMVAFNIGFLCTHTINTECSQNRQHMQHTMQYQCIQSYMQCLLVWLYQCQIVISCIRNPT